MQKLRNKTTAIMIATFLLLSMGASMMLIPTTSAHTPGWQIPTWAYLEVSPNPVGLGQQVTIVMQVDKNPPTATLTGGARWQNLQVVVTKPDGSKQTLGPFTVDPTGGTYDLYTPDQLGTYSFVFSWPGQVLTLGGPSGINGSSSTYVGDTYMASTSQPQTLTVQTGEIPNPPDYPLPTAYWTRPIEGQNTNWFVISSNWLSGCFEKQFVQPDGAAPNSGHIMWASPIDTGGLVGGTDTLVNGTAFYSGISYNARFANPIIMDGKIYTALPQQNNPTGSGVECIDLTTGVIDWINPTMLTPSFGYYYDLEYANQHGTIPHGILFTSNFAQAYDAVTGALIFNVTNVPSGFQIAGPQGEVLLYQLDLTHKWLAEWNSSNLYSYGNSPTIGSTANASLPSLYDWNVTIPSSVPTGTSIQYGFYNDMLLGSSTFTSFSGWGTPNPYTVWAISLKPETRGQLMWIQNYTAPAGNVTRRLEAADPLNRVFIFHDKETFEWTAYSLDTGNQAWQAGMPGATGYEYYDETITKSSIATYDGMLYSSGWGGTLYCYDTKNGNVLWTFGNGGVGNSTNAGLNTAYGHYPFFLMAIADGKIYLGPGEHSPNSPLWKGGQVYCIDAFTGKQLWSLDSWFGFTGRCAAALADGYLTYENLYDSQIYSIGKGPSALAVEAPMADIAQGSGLVIRGTVTDISAGTKQTQQAADFPIGVPCVSDASQSAWMEYVYMQKPKPIDATGVAVLIDVVDANGNYRNIGNITSDSSGAFSLQWTPDIPGKYTVIATFAGSNSYWPSSAETSFAVDPAAPTASPYPVTVLPPMGTYIAEAVAAIVLAIIIVGVVIVLALRKRP